MDDDHVEAPVAPPPVVSHSLSQTYASTVQEDSIPDINEVLEKLNLSDYSSKFHDEKVDTETLVRLIYFLLYSQIDYCINGHEMYSCAWTHICSYCRVHDGNP